METPTTSQTYNSGLPPLPDFTPVAVTEEPEEEQAIPELPLKRKGRGPNKVGVKKPTRAKRGKPKIVYNANGERVVDDFDLKLDEYDHFLIRKEARSHAKAAIDFLGQVAKGKHKEVTISQRIRAAELILDRAGDKPATAEPADDHVEKTYLVLDKSPLPAIPGA